MTETPIANRIRISLFGRRNAGKSSLINALTSQNVAIVSDVPGTTTDPVSKTMEILPLGPCVITDTAGLDDSGELGEMRIKKSLSILDATDIAILAIPCDCEFSSVEKNLTEKFTAKKIPFIVVRTKLDLCESFLASDGEIAVSSTALTGIDQLRERLSLLSPSDPDKPLVADLVSAGDIVVCVCPIDESAPKGRLILPQQQLIRELLDAHAMAVVCQPSELAGLVAKIGKANIKFVVTDSQAFAEVDAALDADVPLTSFSILFARKKGDLHRFCDGAAAIRSLHDSDTVLIAEGCTHKRQCGDIGTVKLPKLLKKFTGKNLKFRFASGGTFDLSDEPPPRLVLHCGGCMLSRKAVLSRMEKCATTGIPIVNYGVAIASMNGITANPDTTFVKRNV